MVFRSTHITDRAQARQRMAAVSRSSSRKKLDNMPYGAKLVERYLLNFQPVCHGLQGKF